MREEIMESSEEDFVRSLSHCVNWQARGGKSGAVFYATEGLIQNMKKAFNKNIQNSFQSHDKNLRDFYPGLLKKWMKY